MARRVLAPTDFTAPAERAVRYAADLAAATGADLELVHVVTAATGAAASLGRLLAVADGLSARGVPTTVTVLGPAEPSAALLDAAGSADLVVIATRGETGDRPGLGSVAAAVARHARSPVLLVDSDTRRVTEGPRILVPVDLSEASAAALREARALAATLGGSIEVLHAVPDEAEAAAWGGEPAGADDEPEPARRLRYVERFVADALSMPSAGTDAEPPPVHVQLAEGDPVEAVVQVARREGADLVLAGRPAGRPTSLDDLLAAVGASGCPTVRVPAR